MHWSESNLPASMQGKSKELKQLFITAATKSFEKNLDEQAAVFAGLQAVSIKERKPSLAKVKAPAVPLHLKAVLDSIKPSVNEFAKSSNIQQAFLPKNSLQVGIDRSLISADFDNSGKLILTFDTGEIITTNEIAIKEYIEQNIAITPNTNITSEDGTVVVTQNNNIFDLSVSPSGFVQTILSSDNSINVLDNQDGTVDITVSEASPASNLVKEVRNETGDTLLKGTIVYVSGAAGNKCLVSKALATTDQTSAQTLGMVSNDILHNKNGYVTIIGLVAGLNTLEYTEGTQLYLSPFVAGAYTSIKHHAPYHLVYVGVVTRSHQNQGTIEIKVQNGYELDELHDVFINDVADGQILTYNSNTNLWENKDLVASSIPNLSADKITSGIFDSARLPSYVDDVLEYNNLSSFPSVGERGKIYVALDNNKTYRWSGSTYIYITSGAVDSVAGKTGVVVLSATDISGLGTAATTDSTAYATSAQGSKADTAYGWGNHALVGYLTSYTETDPIFEASPASDITTTDITNWNTATKTVTYFNKINTVADVTYTIQHNLGLIDKDAFTVNLMLNSESILPAVTSVDVNSITIKTSINTTNLSVMLVGTRA